MNEIIKKDNLSLNLKDKLSNFIGKTLEDSTIDAIEETINDNLRIQLHLEIESFIWDGNPNSISFLDHKSKMEEMGLRVFIKDDKSLIIKTKNEENSVPLGQQIFYQYCYYR